MKLCRISPCLFSCLLTSFSSALEKPESHLRHTESREIRELWFWDTDAEERCREQLDTCEIATGKKDPPYENWIDMLDQLDGGENGYFKNVRALVETLSLSKMSGFEANLRMGAAALAGSIEDVEAAVQAFNDIQKEAKEKQDKDQEEMTGGQLEGIIVGVNTVLENIKRLFPTVDFSPITTIVEVISVIGFAIPQGPWAVINAVVTGFITYLSPLVIDLLGQALGVANSVAAICTAELMDCRFAKMVDIVVPALVGGAFVAQGYAT